MIIFIDTSVAALDDCSCNKENTNISYCCISIYIKCVRPSQLKITVKMGKS